MTSSRIRGLKAKREGDGFEHVLIYTAKSQGVYPIRMPNGCKRVGPKKLIQIKTDFDFILIYEGQTLFLDCKSFDSDRISHSQLTPHQVHALATIKDNQCEAGYLVCFRKAQSVNFFNAHELLNLNPGSSLTFKQGQILGSPEYFNLQLLFAQEIFATNDK